MLVKSFQLTIAAAYDSQMATHTSTASTDIGLARELRNIFLNKNGHMTIWITVRTESVPVNGSGRSVSIMYKTENICHTQQLKCHAQKTSYQNFYFEICMKNFMG